LNHPEPGIVREARSALEDAIEVELFLFDCLEREMERVQSGQLRGGLTPVHSLRSEGIQIAFGYWGPGATPGPYEQTAWTVTSVCKNAIDVAVFDRDASYREGRLVKSDRIHARALFKQVPA